MTATAAQAATLYPYVLEEEQHRDQQVEEALVLTFNVDLGFFEARLLGLMRATGARITVVADANVWVPDVRAVRHAGRSYQFGLVDQPGAFHPKLTVLVGPKRALAAVGSGNLTLGGWQYNRELLTVFTGGVDGMPIAFAGIRDALSGLGRLGVLDPITSRGVARTVRCLDVLLDRAPPVDTGHRVYASWDGPLIERLPTDPVADLYLSAAFHDNNANGIRRLLDQLQPRTVAIALQPGWTDVDPVALDATLTSYRERMGADVTLLRDPESPGTSKQRYRHGKLIEWVTFDGSRSAMTGSPNLSAAGLLNRPVSFGNYELAVVGPVETSLFPGGEPIQADAIPARVDADDGVANGSSARAVRVLAATIKDNQLSVFLSGISDGDVVVEISHRSDHPDLWSLLGEIPEGSASGVFETSVPAGSRVRTAHAVIGPTAPVFVTDENRVNARATPAAKPSRLHRSRAADLFGDDLELLNLIQAELAGFASDVTNARLPPSPGASEGEQVNLDRGATDPFEPWLWLQTDSDRRYGPSLTSWLLALPMSATPDSSPVPWGDIITDEQAVGLQGDEEAAEVDETLTEKGAEAAAVEAVDHTDDAEHLRKSRRTWAVKAAGQATALTVPSRLLVLRITLALWTAGNWEEDDQQPFDLVRDLVRGLPAPDQPREIEERVASLAAVALTVMRQRTDVMVGSGPTVRFTQARDAVGHLVEAASEESIEAYVTGLRTVNGGTLTTSHVIRTRDDLLGHDPLAELSSAMEARGLDFHRPSLTSMHILGGGQPPALTALEAIGFAQDHDGIVVWVTTEAGAWACVAWRSPDLVTVFSHEHSPRWRHQQLRPRRRPADAARALRGALRSGEGTGLLPDVVNRPKHHRTDEAAAVLTSLGVDSPESPPCCIGHSSDAARGTLDGGLSDEDRAG
ncbi:hypothetical protein [Mumia sp. DW29H23]|uniref:hypothetical protein n=1 Tax=Mumia sp. DW29H23 TaxID=3421241 RepID=UPI003D68D829